MNAIERLPQYLQGVRAPARRLLERHLESLLGPHALLESRVQDLLAGVLGESAASVVATGPRVETVRLQLSSLGLVGTFISAADLARLDPFTLSNLLAVYPLYVNARGTLEGLHILVRLFVSDQSFSIAERTFPRPALEVGVSRLAENGRALRADDAAARSLILTIAAEAEDVPHADILRRVLESELPVGLKAYIVFAPERSPRPADPRSWPTTGDRL